MHIEEGKFYQTAEGKKVGPMHNFGHRDGYPWNDVNLHGNYYSDAGKAQSGVDLIAEWTDDEDYREPGEFGEGERVTSEPIPVSDKLEKMTSAPERYVYENKHPLPPMSCDGGHIDTSDAYAPLAAILSEPYDQAAKGKGKERHANDRDFIDQPIMEIGRMVGPGYQTGQAMKKAQEAVGMLRRGQPDRAVTELLGAINYLAAAVILIREERP